MNSFRERRALRWLLALALVAVTASTTLPTAWAGADPSLTYTVTPQAYNNTVKVAPSTAMLAPRIAVGPDPSVAGRTDVYVVGVDNYTCADLVTVRSVDGGRTFGLPRKTALCLGGGWADAVVTPNGTLIVSAPGPKIYRSFDGGASWVLAVVLGSTADGSTLAWDSATGDVYAAWNPAGFRSVGPTYISVSRDFGATWSVPRSIVGSAAQPSIAAHAGHVVLAVTDQSGSFGAETTGVTSSADGGSTWSALADLAPSGSAYRVNSPSATVSDTGVFAVAWTAEFYNGPGSNPAYTNKTLVSLSRDGGATWSAAAPARSGCICMRGTRRRSSR